MSKTDVKRGDIFYADLSPVVGSEQGGVRPVLIIQNNIGNHYSPTVIVAAITARISKPKMPTHVGIKASQSDIEKDSVILLEQIRTIDKQRLNDRVAHLNKYLMKKVDTALELSVGLSPKTNGKK
ncbi:type II toxin-antitoxin system PemK/MazF family toxin [Nicoliella lavandulae]|uniref:mRNA interferase n=1 Tax=Nicoliella lavandulae TaxID=3082954 RepID=A0ABU8SJT8_9LACO